MKKIYFIINPISGNGRQVRELSQELIKSIFTISDYEVTIEYTKSSGDAVTFTLDAIQKKTDIVVACGGDGTINEIASLLVNTDITFGIIPRGSGNGLATHFGIKKDLNSALLILKKGHFIQMDVGRIGSKYFFSNCGTGIVAEVIHQYEAIPDRKFYGYFKAGIFSLSKISKTKDLKIIVDEIEYTTKHLFVSNSSIMGYNLTITPFASVQDGVFDLVLLPIDSSFKFIIFSLFALVKKHQYLKDVKILKGKNIRIYTHEKVLKLQLDGEALQLDQKEIQISILPNALRIIVPKILKKQ